MEPEKTYQHLEDLAQQLGISIRYEDLYDPEVPATSGLCKVRGRHFYIMDRSKSLPYKIRLLSQCLCRMDLDSVYLLPAIRELLNAARRTTHAD
ncbi:MAG: hypothetical protein JRF30_02495 [Deltaproteobacteria bacterium]|jgi:hypothetical protein|nr:hypothetical protein [Deltaproteobacteria bacterium]MBW1793275.1 hypothetical protein [Deltaproteobacteria bacterium]MBW2329805.1 hypothetical protein [Deltaproteobacteria bacterium]